eukprot:3238507-Prymnesium_polylepis.1
MVVEHRRGALPVQRTLALRRVLVIRVDHHAAGPSFASSSARLLERDDRALCHDHGRAAHVDGHRLRERIVYANRRPRERRRERLGSLGARAPFRSARRHGSSVCGH